jgi:hypothetical protein
MQTKLFAYHAKIAAVHFLFEVQCCRQCTSNRSEVLQFSFDISIFHILEQSFCRIDPYTQCKFPLVTRDQTSSANFEACNRKIGSQLTSRRLILCHKGTCIYNYRRIQKKTFINFEYRREVVPRMGAFPTIAITSPQLVLASTLNVTIVMLYKIFYKADFENSNVSSINK